MRIGNTNFELNRRELFQDVSDKQMEGQRLEVMQPALKQQIIESQQVFPNKSIPVEKLGIYGYNLFEAVVDLSGEGDFISIPAALNSGLKRIFLRSGTYILEDNLVISGDKIILVGEDPETVIIQSGTSAGAAAHNIQITGNDVTLKNIQKTAVSSSTVYPILSSGDRITIDNCIVSNPTTHYRGIKFSDGDECRLFNSKIYASKWPVEVDTDVRNIIISNNFIKTANNDNDEGVLLRAIGGVFSNNVVQNVQTGERGIKVWGQLWQVTNNIVSNASNVGGIAISIEGGDGGNLISGNFIVKWFNGISKEGASAVGLGDIISNNIISDVGNNGIEAEGTSGTNLMVSGNNIFDADGNGITIQGGTGTQIIGNNLDTIGVDGILLDTTTNINSCIVSNNTITQTTGNGIVSIKQTSPVTIHDANIISNNMLISIGNRGLEINATNCNIIGNIVNSSGNINSITNTGGNTQYNIEV